MNQGRPLSKLASGFDQSFWLERLCYLNENPWGIAVSRQGKKYFRNALQTVLIYVVQQLKYIHKYIYIHLNLYFLFLCNLLFLFKMSLYYANLSDTFLCSFAFYSNTCKLSVFCLYFLNHSFDTFSALEIHLDVILYLQVMVYKILQWCSSYLMCC